MIQVNCFNCSFRTQCSTRSLWWTFLTTLTSRSQTSKWLFMAVVHWYRTFMCWLVPQIFTRECSSLKIYEIVINLIIISFTAWRVGLGSNFRSSHLTLISNRAVAHPQYAEVNNVRMNDIGIIFLQQPVELSSRIFPILLPPIVSEAHPHLNTQGMFLGFAGSASSGNEGLEHLQAAHVRTMPHASCILLYANADANQHFCANDVERGSNLCLGDQVRNVGGLIRRMLS